MIHLKKKRGTVLLSLLLVLVMSLGVLPGLMLAEGGTEAVVKKLVILHTNDMHGRAVGDKTPGKDGLPVDKGAIGFARYMSVINTLKAANEDRVLVFDAGDGTHGTNFATLSHGQSMIRLMNDLGVHAMAIGNHEFNYGFADLELMAKEADFPFLAANIIKDEDQSKPFPANQVFEVDGLKIGVFGLATPETKVKSSPPNTEGLSFADPAEVAAEQVEELKAQGVNAIVMLAHLGTDEESEFTSRYVLDRVQGIDLVIDGHSHSYLPEGEVYNESLIVQTGAMMANIGVCGLTFTDGVLSEKSSRLISFLEAQQYAADEAVAASIAAVEEENKRFTEVEVGKTKVQLDGEREDVRTHETNLADLIVDAMLWSTDADCAINNGGNVRATIPVGPITMGDLLTVMPFGNMVTVIEVSGKDIKDALAFGADAYPGTAGKFPHVANLSYEIHKVGDDKYEVQNVKLKGEDLVDDQLYKLCTNDFLAVGGDGYSMFEGKPQLLLQGLMVDIVKDYIAEQCKDSAELEYATDGRITIVD